MSKPDLLQQYIDDLNEIADLCKGESGLDYGQAAMRLSEICCLCERRIKELDEMKATSPAGKSVLEE